MNGTDTNGEKRTPCTWVLLVAVCDRDRAKRIMGLFRGRGSLFNLATLGRGTASSKILNYLGLGETEKTVLFSAMPASEARAVIEETDRRLELKRPGRGIVFTLPLEEQDTGGRNMEECRYRLVVAMVNRGYTEEVMDAARAANAAGGTVIHAREFSRKAEKFFKVTIQPEKEVVFILAESSGAGAIVRSIADRTGPETAAGATTVTLPVLDVEGLRASSLPEPEQA